MPHFTTLAGPMTAICAALALSLALIGQALSAPQAASPGRIASAYVGAVA